MQFEVYQPILLLGDDRLNIVLFEPEIPHNTGAIGRTCFITGSRLHLIRPLGFSIDERSLKRSGLDYWKELNVTVYDDLNDFYAQNPGATVYYAETRTQKRYDQVAFKQNDYIMFGKETTGLPQQLLEANGEYCIRIPMLPNTRSLNLSVSAGIVLYEALRQNGFVGLNS